MKSSAKLACFRSMTLLGCFLVTTQQFVSWYWGNLNVYTDSYLRATLGPDSGFQTPWTVSCSMIAAPMGMALSNVVRKYLGTHGTLLVACLAYSLTLGLSYFTISQSVVLFEVILGWATGCSFGLTLSHVLWIVREWSSSRHIGFYSGLVTSGAGLGPLIIIQLSTWFINPDNKIPDLRTGNNAFFTQEEILNRVPSVFLVLCGFALSVQLLSILFIRDVKHVLSLDEKTVHQTIVKTNQQNCEEQSNELNSHFHESRKRTALPQNGTSSGHHNSCHHKPQVITEYDSIMSNASSSERKFIPATYGANNGSKLEQDGQLIYGTDLITKEDHNSTDRAGTSADKDIDNEAPYCSLMSKYGDKVKYMDRPEVVNDEMRDNDMNKTLTKTEDDNYMRDACRDEGMGFGGKEIQEYQTAKAAFGNSERSRGDLSPLQVLKTPTFYIICLCANCSDLSFLLSSNFYKAYGQLHIKDDHLLADVGTAILIGYILTRPIWGLMIDYIGLKNTLLFFASGLALGSAVWYFTLQVDNILFFIWTVMLGSLNAGFYFVFAMCSLKLFGRQYYTSNLGLILASSVPLNLLCPHIIALILGSSGYAMLFLTSSCLSTVGLILIVLVLPRKEVD